jgi:hypothetical protein
MCVHSRPWTSEHSLVSEYVFISENVDNIAGFEYVKLVFWKTVTNDFAEIVYIIIIYWA